uniref:FeoB-associated Cys-rich membrane protein n=1 Tax=Brachyspira catarrhinii TaxID=2528966 RepID=UPI003F4B31F3
MDIVIVAFIVGAALIFLITQAVKNINKLNNNKCSCDCKNCNCQNKHRKLI